MGKGRASVVHEILTKLPDLLGDLSFSLWFPVKQRFDLLSNVQKALAEKSSSKLSVVVQCHGQDRSTLMPSQQRMTDVPSFSLLVPFSSKQGAIAPSFLSSPRWCVGTWGAFCAGGCGLPFHMMFRFDS